jgi:hypothetical protein
MIVMLDESRELGQILGDGCTLLGGTTKASPGVAYRIAGP